MRFAPPMGLTTMHLDEEQVQRVLHDELAPATESRIRDHLDTCDECRTRVGHAGREETRIFELLQTIDRPVSAMRSGSAVRQARDRRSSWPTRAAAVVIGVAIAGAAYAAPGSPMRALLRGLVVHRIDRPSAPAIQRDLPNDTQTAGVAVSPGARLTIDITTSPRSGVATVLLVDGDEVVVRAAGGRPTFHSALDRLIIENSTTVTALSIEIPRRAPLVEVRLDGRRVLRKAGSEMTGAKPDSIGRYVLAVNR